MSNKQIQEERMRSYFITAASELIRAEGLVVASARNIADKAGYSYATLYNYFKDTKDLIFNCVEDFLAECKTFVAENTPENVCARNRIIAGSVSYAKYFVQYPGIFDVFYTQKLSDISTKNSKISQISSLFDDILENDWVRLQKERHYTTARLAHIRSTYRMAIHGLLQLYLHRRLNMEYKTMLAEIEKTFEVVVTDAK
jgi:AcrR family transcriptional regulator